MKPEIYAVTAYRWGDLDGHSYLVGVYGKKQAALDAARLEQEYRGGKYECEVIQTVVVKKWDKDQIRQGQKWIVMLADKPVRLLTE